MQKSNQLSVEIRMNENTMARELINVKKENKISTVRKQTNKHKT